MAKRLFFVVVAALILIPAGRFVAQDPAIGQQVQVIEVTAKKYEFNPSEIRVKKGTRVQLKIRALDRTHGMEFELYPENSDRKGEVGLRFTPEQKNWRLEKGNERVIEFVAERSGTYAFKCSVFCGFSHGRMKGKLVVED